MNEACEKVAKAKGFVVNVDQNKVFYNRMHYSVGYLFGDFF